MINDKLKKFSMLIWTGIITLSVLFDQLTKWITVQNLSLHESVVVIDGIFSFTHIRNYGAAWGMLKDHRWVFLLITGIAIIVLPIILYKYRNTHILFGIALSLIIGGAVGNMIDRVFLGYVVDFLEATFIDFPVFNVADICVVVGTGLMALYILFFDKTFFVETKKEKKAPEVTNGTDNKNL